MVVTTPPHLGMNTKDTSRHESAVHDHILSLQLHGYTAFSLRSHGEQRCQFSGYVLNSAIRSLNFNRLFSGRSKFSMILLEFMLLYKNVHPFQDFLSNTN